MLRSLDPEERIAVLGPGTPLSMRLLSIQLCNGHPPLGTKGRARR